MEVLHLFPYRSIDTFTFLDVEELYVRSITHTYCHTSARPRPPQLTKEHVTPDHVFDRVSIDYAGPVLIKHAHVRKQLL